MEAAPSSSKDARGAGAMTALALRLVKQFAAAETAAATGKNLTFSPLSIYSLLSLVAEGARGATLDELLAFLGAGSRDELTALVRAVAASALADGSRSGGPRVAFACGVWHDESRALKPAYRAAASASYKAETRAVDFRHKPEEARKTINSWVARATSNLIDSVLEAGSVREDTGLVLANAIYFKGKWEVPFSKDATGVEKFYLLGGAAVDAPLMRMWGRQLVAVHGGFKVLKLPYTAAPRSGQIIKGSVVPSFSMCVFLPDERDGLWRLVDKIASRPGFLRDHLPTEKVMVGKFRLPKFKTSFADDKLAGTLKEMGLKVTFDPARANLSGMAEDGGSGMPLVIEEVVHKAVIEVNEEGTEAAAVSATYIRCMAAPWKLPLEIVDFVADHPFAFFVVEEVSEAVVFAGYVLNPLL
ncbi:unnamed protein product [Urochloa humidicola]